MALLGAAAASPLAASVDQPCVELDLSSSRNFAAFSTVQIFHCNSIVTAAKSIDPLKKFDCSAA